MGNNSINSMDSVKVSENTDEICEENDKISNISLNLSGIAADLMSIKQDNFNSIEEERFNYNFDIENNNELSLDKSCFKYSNNYENNNRFSTKEIKGDLNNNLKKNKVPLKKFEENNNYFYEKNLNNENRKSQNFIDKKNEDEKLRHQQIKNQINYYDEKKKNNYYQNNNYKSENTDFNKSNIETSSLYPNKSKKNNDNNDGFTKKETDDLVNKYLEENFFLIPEKSKNKNIENKYLEKNLKNDIIKLNLSNKSNEKKSTEIKYNEEKYSEETRNYINNKLKSHNLPNNNENAETPQRNNNMNDKYKNINEILVKLPDLINQFNLSKTNIAKNNFFEIESNKYKENVTNKFFNLNNLSNLLEITRKDFNNPETNKKNILNEAENIINNHILKVNKNEKNTDLENELDDSKYRIDNKKDKDISEKEIYIETEESVNDKINYLYDVLKNLTQSKLKELIQNPFNKKHNHQKNLEDNDLIFSDNKKISFEIPKTPIKISGEFEDNSLSSESKNTLAELQKRNEEYLNKDSLDIKKNLDESFTKKEKEINSENENNSSYNFDINEKIEEKIIEDNKIIKNNINSKYNLNTSEIIEKIEEKLIENNFMTETNNNSKENPYNFIKKTEENINEDINELDNNIIREITNENENTENIINISNNPSEEIINISNSNFPDLDKISKRINFSNNFMDNQTYQSNTKIDFDRNINNPENQIIYSEDEPRSLDDCIISNSKTEMHNLSAKNLSNSEYNLKSKLKKEDYTENKEIKKLKFVKFQSESDILNQSKKSNTKDLNNSFYLENNPEIINKIVDNRINNNYNIKNKVCFNDKLIFIEYDENSLPQEIKITNNKGKLEKHTKFNMLNYFIKLKNNKYKCRKVIHYYYNGIRDDQIPKKLINSLKRTNSFNEYDKEIGLKKLNEFLNECSKENELNEIKQTQMKKIGNFIFLFLSGKK